MSSPKPEADQLLRPQVGGRHSRLGRVQRRRRGRKGDQHRRLLHQVQTVLASHIFFVFLAVVN